MLKETQIDYLQFSSERRLYGEYAVPENSRMSFYTTQEQMSSGMVCHYGSQNSVKFLYVASGNACAKIFAEHNPPEYLEKLLSLGARFSRLDIAITQYIDHDGLVLPKRVLHWHDRNKIISPLARYGATALYKSSSRNFETVYVGDWRKRGKRGIFRAYDKGEELGLGDKLLTRFEIEDKRDKAHNSARRIAEGASLEQVFKSRFDVPTDDDFQALLDCEPMTMTRDRDNETASEDEAHRNRWHWLVTQVAPALGQAIARDHASDVGDANYDIFMRHVNNHYRKRKA